jgi:MFS family permease
VLLAFYREVRPPPPERGDTDAGAPAPGARLPWKNRPFFVFSLIVFGVGLIAYQHLATLPLYIRFTCGQPESFFGLLVALNTSIVILFELPVIPWLQRRRRTSVMAAGILLFGLGYGLYGVSTGWVVLVGATVVWTVGEIVLLPMAAAHAAAMAPPESRGRYMGAYVTAFGASFILAPLLGGPVLDAWGGRILWVTCLALGAGLAAVMWAVRPGEDSTAHSAAGSGAAAGDDPCVVDN